MQKFLNFFFLSSFACVSLSIMAEDSNATSVENEEKTIETSVENEKKAVETNGQTQIVQYEKYTNIENGYSIEYPSNWKKSDVPHLDLVLFAPTEKNDKTHASLNVFSEKIGAEISLEYFFSESTNNLTSALKDVKIEKTGTTLFNGISAKWIQYTHTMQGIKLRVLQYFIVSGKTIYLITFSDSDEDFEKYHSDSEQIANTFQLLK